MEPGFLGKTWQRAKPCICEFLEGFKACTVHKRSAGDLCGQLLWRKQISWVGTGPAASLTERPRLPTRVTMQSDQRLCIQLETYWSISNMLGWIQGPGTEWVPVAWRDIRRMVHSWWVWRQGVQIKRTGLVLEEVEFTFSPRQVMYHFVYLDDPYLYFKRTWIYAKAIHSHQKDQWS